MLIELFGRNFGCFRDPFSLSLLATDIEPGSDEGVVEVEVEGDDEPLRLLRCAAIYGPNASGKSTLLRAASALGYLIAESGSFASDRKLAPHEPFMLDDESAQAPVQLGARFVVGNRAYIYAIEFDRSRFALEELIELGRDGDVALLVRHGDRVGGVGGEWTKHPSFDLLRKSFRSNALLLSLADQFVPDLAAELTTALKQMLHVIDATEWEHASMWRRGPSTHVARQMAKDQAFAAWMLDLLNRADTGIESYTIREYTRPIPDQEDADDELASRRLYGVDFKHRGQGGPRTIPYRRESLGTRKTVELGWHFRQLSHGDDFVASFIDEIAASMHPQLLRALIGSFNRETPMSRVRGQLIFATHETSLLEGDSDLAPLRRDQVYFTEKATNGAARLYSLSEFGERNNLNLRKRYLQGRYGAIPAIGDLGTLGESE